MRYIHWITIGRVPMAVEAEYHAFKAFSRLINLSGMPCATIKRSIPPNPGDEFVTAAGWRITTLSPLTMRLTDDDLASGKGAELVVEALRGRTKPDTSTIHDGEGIYRFTFNGVRMFQHMGKALFDELSEAAFALDLPFTDVSCLDAAVPAFDVLRDAGWTRIKEVPFTVALTLVDRASGQAADLVVEALRRRRCT